ncbi:EcsC family protein [Bacillus sp. 03113]|uniref:EcsC family protein n=1 Tax=Bacillus sp. 03113 TaxID=2578211 RepID=UPI0011443117|nr:EcsC family protein [Bacillus sp. 03113]
MPLDEREIVTLTEIREWENKLRSYEPNDFSLLLQKYIEQSFSLLPTVIKEKFFSSLDQWLFHLQSLIQSSHLQAEAKERILTIARSFLPEIDSVQDLKKLKIDQIKYIADQQISRHRLYSFAHGGVSGTGKALLLGSDLPGVVVINLRAVQLIAVTYGFDTSSPVEMETSLKVFHAAILPPHIRMKAWEKLMGEIEEHQTDNFFYAQKEELSDMASIEQILKEILKIVVIFLLRKKTFQGFPIISMAIGAGINYQLTRKVTDFSHKYYQMRYLFEKKERNK